MTGEELVDEVQALAGRTGDTVLITDARVAGWLNEGQRDIVERTPGLDSRLVDDCTSWYCVSDQHIYEFANLTSGCEGYEVCHPARLFYINGVESLKLDYMPTDEFDSEYPDPTHSDHSPAKPQYWTIRGSTVEVWPRPGEDYAAAAAGDLTGVFRFVYTAYGRDFTVVDTSASDISRADPGLVYFAVAEAWGAKGDEPNRALWKMKYENWLAKYQDRNTSMQAWDWNLY